jgi:hypothetical protein
MSITQVSGADPDQLLNALGDARTLLLLASDSPAVDEVCSALLSVASPGDTKLLSVTLDGTPDDRLATLRAHYGDLPAETGVIAVGETTRSAASTAPTGPEADVVSIDTVSDPSDLTGLAMSVGSYLDAWSDTTATPVVCFHSITSLLFHAETDRVFRFLHSTTGRLRDIGAVSHYHLDPSAYEDSTVNSFAALFDAVVQVDPDGAVSVQKRR